MIAIRARERHPGGTASAGVPSRWDVVAAARSRTAGARR
jgi:hypothetical protein